MAQKGGYILKALKKKNKKDTQPAATLPTIGGKKPDIEGGKKKIESQKKNEERKQKETGGKPNQSRRKTNVDARTGTNTSKTKKTSPKDYNKQVKQQKENDKSLSIRDQGRVGLQTDLETAKQFFNPNVKTAHQKNIEEKKQKKVQTYMDNPALTVTNTSKNNGSTWKNNSADRLSKKAQKAYDEGDYYHGDLYSAKASQKKEEAKQLEESQKKAHTLSNSEIALIENASRTGTPDVINKVLTNAENGAYINEEKTEDNPYAGVKQRYANQSEVNYAKSPFGMGVIEGTNLIPLSSYKMMQAQTGIEIDPTGYSSGAYKAGETAAILGAGLATGGLMTGEKILGNGIKNGAKALIENAKKGMLIDLPLNAKVSAQQTIADNEGGAAIPESLGNTPIYTDKSKGGVYATTNTEPGATSEDVGGVKGNINNWNDDIVAQSQTLSPEKQEKLVWGKDKYGKLHYSTSKDKLDQIIEYYDTSVNPEYTLNDKRYASPGLGNNVRQFAKNMAINTAVSGVASGVTGGLGAGAKAADNGATELAETTAKQTVKEDAKEVAETTINNVEKAPKERPKSFDEGQKTYKVKAKDKDTGETVDVELKADYVGDAWNKLSKNGYEVDSAKDIKYNFVGEDEGARLFHVKALDKNGNPTELTIRGDHRPDALKKARDNGYTVDSVHSVTEVDTGKPVRFEGNENKTTAKPKEGNSANPKDNELPKKEEAKAESIVEDKAEKTESAKAPKTEPKEENPTTLGKGDNTYTVKAKDSDGKEITLEVKAKNKTEARSTAKENGYTVGKGKENVELATKEEKPKASKQKKEAKPKDESPKLSTKKDAKKEKDSKTFAIDDKSYEAAIKNIDDKKYDAEVDDVIHTFKTGEKIVFDGMDENGDDVYLIMKNGKPINPDGHTEEELKQLLEKSKSNLPDGSVGADASRELTESEALIKDGYEYAVAVKKADGTEQTVKVVAKSEKDAKNIAKQQTGGKILDVEESRKIQPIRGEEGSGKVADTTEYGKTTQGADTVHDSNVVRGAKNPDAMREEILKGVKNGDFVKTYVSSNELGVKATKDVAKDVNAVQERFNKIVYGDSRIKSEHIADGYALADHYAKAGMEEEAAKVLSDVAMLESETGRTLQAMKLFQRMSTKGRQKAVDKMVDRIVNGRDIKIDKESDKYKQLVQNILDAEGDNAKTIKANREFAKYIWDQVPPTLGEKLGAWRYLSMLGNPKTHVRNIMGNLMMKPVRAASDGLATGIEKVFAKRFEELGGVKGTKAFNTGKDRKELKEFANKVYADHKLEIEANSSKYFDRARPMDSDVFRTKWLNKAVFGNSRALELEDTMFSKSAFKKAFAQYCQKNGYREATMTEAQMESAIKYASRKGAESTYREMNELADMLNKFRKNHLTPRAGDSKTAIRTKKAGGLFFDSAMPFVKTPANILKQGIMEYSPYGLIINGPLKIARATTAEELAKGIEVLSSGMVGSAGLTTVGAYLAWNDIAHGKIGEYTDKVANYKKLLGDQDYSIEINNKRIDLDWIAPQSIPFFIGVEMASCVKDALSDDELSGADVGWAIGQGLINATDPIFEMSMLSGLSNIFETTFSGNTVKEMGVNAIENYFSQMIPTLANQFGKYVTPNSKRALSTSDIGTKKELEKYGKTLANKVPGLKNKFGNDSVDVWGNLDTSGYYNGAKRGDTSNPLKQAFDVFLNPATVTKDSSTEVDKEIMRLYEATGEDGVIPTWANNEYSVSFNDNTYRMTPVEYTEYQQTLGQARYNAIQELINTEDWNAYKKNPKKDRKTKGLYKLDEDGNKIPKMTDEEKVKAITDIYSNLKSEARNNWLVNSGHASQEEIDAKNLNEWIHINKNADVVDLYESGNLTIKQAKSIVNTKGSATMKTAVTLAKGGKTYDDLVDLGVSEETAAKGLALAKSGISYEKMAKDLEDKKAIKQYDGYKTKGSGTKDGKLNTADEIQAYLKTKNWSAEKKWMYLYVNSGVSAKSRSKYGY